MRSSKTIVVFQRSALESSSKADSSADCTCVRRHDLTRSNAHLDIRISMFASKCTSYEKRNGMFPRKKCKNQPRAASSAGVKPQPCCAARRQPQCVSNCLSLVYWYTSIFSTVRRCTILPWLPSTKTLWTSRQNIMRIRPIDQHINGWVNTPNVRGTGGIIWSCFLAVFVCTWTILHLNLPAHGEHTWQRLLRKAKWMTLAILVPEVVTASAFAQRVAARSSVQSMEKLDCSWKMSQAFYLNMGGVWLQPRDSKAFPINAAQLQYLIKKDIMACPAITKREIWDRSKADKFAKVFVCLQIFWLAFQCVVRAIQGLSITPLEIATLGFAVPSLATFAFWYHKPVDIEVPNTICLELTTTELLEKVSPRLYSWRDTPLDFISKVNTPSVTSELVLKHSWWPGRERFIGPADRIRNDVFALKYSKMDQVVVFLVWLGYAGTHFSAWTFSFPTAIEMLWWRYSCIVMSSSMGIFWITSNRKFYLLIPMLMPWLKHKERFRKAAYEQQQVSAIQIFAGVFTTLAYLVSRLSLIALAFSSLRSLPEDAFRTVNWITLWPHLT